MFLKPCSGNGTYHLCLCYIGKIQSCGCSWMQRRLAIQGPWPLFASDSFTLEMLVDRRPPLPHTLHIDLSSNSVPILECKLRREVIFFCFYPSYNSRTQNTSWFTVPGSWQIPNEYLFLLIIFNKLLIEGVGVEAGKIELADREADKRGPWLYLLVASVNKGFPKA